MGSTRPFDAFTFFFRETEHGIFIAHCYQYEAGPLDLGDGDRPGDLRARRPRPASTRQASARFLEEVFAEELDGHRLIANRSHLAQLPDDPLRSAGRTTTSC